MKIRSRWLIRLLTGVVVLLGHCVFASCRKVYLCSGARSQSHPPPHDDDPQRYLVLTWHEALLFPAFCSTRTQRRRTVCLTSRHRDGQFIEDFTRWLGIGAVRGSTQHGGAEALRQLMDLSDKHILITPDGPRGPRRKLKPGPAFLASQTGRPILLTAFACPRAWRIRGNWTDLIIPQPFTTIYVLTALPVTVSPHLTREDLDRVTQSLQDQWDSLQAAAELLVQPVPRSAGQDAEAPRAAA